MLRSVHFTRVGLALGESACFGLNLCLVRLFTKRKTLAVHEVLTFNPIMQNQDLCELYVIDNLPRQASCCQLR